MKKQLSKGDPYLLAAKIGGCVWLLLAASSFLPQNPLGIVEILFLLAPWVIVPLGLSFALEENRIALLSRLHWILPVAAMLATVSFFVTKGFLSACLAAAWFLVCIVIACDGARRFFLLFREKSFEQFCFAVGEGYLLVAGLWLVASRVGLHPFGFREPIVLLTAMHFHFAGFASAILAGLTCNWFRGKRGEGLVRAAALAVLLGPGLLGLAFLAGPKVKLIGAMLVAVGQIGLAAAMIRVALQAGRGIGRWLLLVAAGSVAAGMVFAMVWAVGEYPLQPFVDIRKMAEVHGVFNAIGFAVCGFYGWLRIKAATKELVSERSQGLAAMASRSA